jgi:hypothetical protein
VVVTRIDSPQGANEHITGIETRKLTEARSSSGGTTSTYSPMGKFLSDLERISSGYMLTRDYDAVAAARDNWLVRRDEVPVAVMRQIGSSWWLWQLDRLEEGNHGTHIATLGVHEHALPAAWEAAARFGCPHCSHFGLSWCDCRAVGSPIPGLR